MSDRLMRWEPYVFIRGPEFGTFWCRHLGERERNLLVIAGLGFDPRASNVSRALMASGGKGRRDLWLLCYDNDQQIRVVRRSVRNRQNVSLASSSPADKGSG